MAHQIADGDVFVRVGVVHLEIRQIFFWRIVEREFALVLRHQNGQGGKCLRRRADRKLRIGRDGDLVLKILITEAFHVNDLVVL